MKTFNYKSGLVPIDADITVVFQFEHYLQPITF